MTSLDPTETATATETETATETDGPVGCEEPALPGEVCHHIEPLPLPPGCTPRPVLIADLDQDGRGDVIVACEAGPLVFFPGMEFGYGPMEVIHPEAGPAPRDLAVAQFDGEGGPDVVVINEVPVEGVRVYYQAEPMFDYMGFGVEGLSPTRVAVGPWFGEMGLPDLFVTVTTSEIRPLSNDNAGGFMAGAGFPVLVGPRGLVMGQFDGDGNVDVGVVSEGSMGVGGGLRLFFGDGGGAPAGGVVDYPDGLGTEPNAVILADLDMDRSIDIIHTRGGPGRGLRILYGNGMGDFVGMPLDHGELLRGLASGDFDANNKPDLVLADGAGELIFLMGDDAGMPWFEDYVDLGGADPFAIAAGRIDGDAHTDLAVSLPDEGEVLILQSSP